MSHSLPRRARGRQNGAAEAQYQEDLRQFCAQILEIRSTLDFEVGTRGWGYLLENQGTITKGQLDEAERLITRCRKDGLLPLDICAEDSKRAANGIEDVDEDGIAAKVDAIAHYVQVAHCYYTPISFWDDRASYLELATEKSDLRSLFERVAAEFHIINQNIGGWADLNVRAGMMRRFKYWEAKGKRCVLLYCGDHDPGGLQISDCLYANFAELERAVGWSPRNLIIARFGFDYDFIEANGLTWIDNLETSSGKSLADPRHCDHRKPYVQEYLRGSVRERSKPTHWWLAPKPGARSSGKRFCGTSRKPELRGSPRRDPRRVAAGDCRTVAPMNKPGMRLLRWRPLIKNSLRGFAGVELPNGLTVREIPILTSHGKCWASLPVKPVLDANGKHVETNGKKQYAAMLEWRSRELSDAFSTKLVGLVRGQHPAALDGRAA
jgi:hypothetical protein